jgi:hypothetical protein
MEWTLEASAFNDEAQTSPGQTHAPASTGPERVMCPRSETDADAASTG